MGKKREVVAEPGLKIRVTDPTGVAVAENLGKARILKSLSREEVSARLLENGVELSANALGRIERRQRKIEVGELTALAYALETNVAELLSEGEREFTGVPSKGYSTAERGAWISGHVKELSDRAVVDFHESLINERQREIEEEGQIIEGIALLIEELGQGPGSAYVQELSRAKFMKETLEHDIELRKIRISEILARNEQDLSGFSKDSSLGRIRARNNWFSGYAEVYREVEGER